MLRIKTKTPKLPKHFLSPRFARFDEDYECNGEWWLAQYPERRVQGKLTYSPNSGAVLSCSGRLVGNGLWQSPGEIAVFGQIGVNVPVSLWGLFYRFEQYTPSHETIYAVGVIIGLHVKETTPPLDWLCVGLKRLSEWCAPGPFDSGLSYDHDGEVDGRVRVSFIADHKLAECGEVASLGANCLLSLTQQENGFGYSTQISFERQLIINLDKGVGLLDSMAVAHRLELLFSLLTGGPSFLTSLRIAEQDGQPGNDAVVLLGNSWEHNDTSAHRSTMPTTLESLPIPLGEVISKWIALYDRYELILNLLASSLYGAGTFDEDRFLSLAQAVEGYCRIRWADNYLSSDDFEPIRNAMLSLISEHNNESFRAVATSRINSLAGLSLQDRLRHMLAVEPWLAAFFKRKDDDRNDEVIINDFVVSVAQTRNKLTHIESNKSKKPLRIVDELSWQLRAVLCASLLGQAGIPFSNYSERLVKYDVPLYRSWW